MGRLQQIDLQERGNVQGIMRVKRQPDVIDIIYFVWMDMEQRYFISTESSMDENVPYHHCRWRQAEKTENTDPEQAGLSVSQPKVCKVYYTSYTMINRHNMCRYDDLNIKKKIETKD